MDLIRERHSTRLPFNPNRPVASEEIHQILEAGRWAPTAHNMQNFEIVVVDDPVIIEAIGKTQRPVSPVFIHENYAQLSFSEEELLRRKTGLLATMFPPAWRNRDYQPEPGSPSEEPRPFPGTAAMLVALYDPAYPAPVSEGDFLGILSLGCVLENMWLMAASLGIGFHVMSAFAGGETAANVRGLLGIPENWKIAFTVRLGYPAMLPGRYLRVRRDVEDFCHHNRFGNHDLA
jgi:nitroreductase